jgi:hypothetical protein
MFLVASRVSPLVKKLLTLILLSISCSSFANSHIDFSLSDFCYLQPNVQDRDGVYFFPNQQIGITASSLCVFKNAYGLALVALLPEYFKYWGQN